MEHQPLISIIIPVYNVEQYISKCLDSIISQIFTDWEALVVDDGSTDSSGIICDQYASIEKRITVFHKQNEGVSSARNLGLEHVKGLWVWFVDSDDYIVENSLSKIADSLARYKCDTMFMGYISENNGIEKTISYKKVLNHPKSAFLEKTFSWFNQTMIFDFTIIKKFNLRFSAGIRMAEDLEYQYKYLIQCQRPISLPDVIYYYNLREGSAMRNPSTYYNNIQNSLQVCWNLLCYIRDNNVPEELWLSIRIRGLLKNCLQSAEKIPSNDIKDLQNKIRDILNEYKKAGFKNITDRTLKIAQFNLPLYFVMLRCYNTLHQKGN